MKSGVVGLDHINFYFAINEQALLLVFPVLFCFTHDKHNLIKLKLCNN